MTGQVSFGAGHGTGWVGPISLPNMCAHALAADEIRLPIEIEPLLFGSVSILFGRIRGKR
jgi:hypothetical protein